MPSSAERQRRYRAHMRGDHSLCDPDRADCASVTVTPDATRNGDAPAALDLGARGARLWRDMTADGPDLRPGERVLLEEACRTADRLAQLDRIVRGDADVWLRFRDEVGDGDSVRVVVNPLLAEARQQQIALKQLLTELRQSRASDNGRSTTPRRPTGQTGGGPVASVTDLAARIAARRPTATG